MPLPPTQVLLQPRTVIRILGAIALLLLAANVGGLLVTHVAGHDHLGGLIPFFDFDAEQNLPTFFSACLFLVGAFLLFIVWRVRPQLMWLVLAGVLVFLAFDELFQVHERLIRPVRELFHLSGFLFFAWVVVYGAGVLALGGAFVSLWRRLPRHVRWWLGASAATYVVGAIGFEMLGARHYEAMQGAAGDRDLLYGVLYTVEESLEIAGLIMLIHGLLVLLQSEREGCAIVIPGAQTAGP